MKSVTSLLSLATLAAAQREPAAQIPLEPSTVLTPSEPLTLDAIPLLGFGTWNLYTSNASAAVSWAIQSGFRHIDCAAIYRDEKQVGQGIKEGLEMTGLVREDLWITSKLWNDHHGSAKHVQSGIDGTLRDLGVGYLDLYHMHWPVSNGKHGNKIEYKETWDAMTELVKQGKTRHVGVSNFSPAQLRDLLEHTDIPPAVHQMELHPYLQQNDWIKFHKDHGIHVTGYSPFAGTNPTYSPGEPPQLLNNSVMINIAEKRGCTTAQVAIQWGMHRGTSVIPKSQHEDRISENFASLACELEESDFDNIDNLGEYHHRFNNPSKSWGLDLYHGLEDSKGKHKA